ncbi:Arb2 domain-containing protein [Annulohypoxylon truncatum]|uniref:Arb2 domain-containing protein n=1 Tax=Annulohypoxylon truncatum TaxID=327061 RepID=UPI002008A43F|nr:Arb2 domain-containing protein [Annulohypoxylon truncatum]KAI1212662.1 Arb2 domain-containing protein [Annulohypoxylon truncatum]
MFRRKWEGLPADPDFPVDLEKLGYFINEEDEVRAIDNPNNYFKFFLNRNPRWNERQRFAMNQALQGVIWERLERLGMKKVLLPLGTEDTSKPHVPIFVSKDIASASRVVVIFGETGQDLGVLAHRVIGGPGGVNKGSMVSILSSLMEQSSSSVDLRPPGVILANTGELIWWPEGNRTLSRIAFNAVPMKSAVHLGNLITDANLVEKNEDALHHISHMFKTVIPHFVNDGAKIDIIGVGDGADLVETYLDHLLIKHDKWKSRISCLALVGGTLPAWELKNEEFAKVFLRKKARAYATSTEPAGMIISGPDGNPNTTTFTEQGCPVFSSGSEHYTELTLIRARDIVLDWMQEVAMTPEDEEYTNPEYHVVYCDPKLDLGAEPDWSQWEDEALAGGGEKEECQEAQVQEGGTQKGEAQKSLEEPVKDKGKEGKAVAWDPRLVIVEPPKAEETHNDNVEVGEGKDEN